MKKFLLGLGIFILILVVVLSYLGIMPFFSKYLAKQVDLGVKADPAWVASFESKYAPTAKDGKVSLDVNLGSTEVTSIFAVWETRDKNFPLHNVQIRFNSDGTGEASGYLKVSTAVNLAKQLGYSDSDIERGKSYIQYVSGDLPFYVKGTGGISDNVLTINPTTFQLGRITVPESVTKMAAVAVGDMIERRIKQIGGANIQVANFKSGSFRLVGSVPETIKY